MLMSHGGGPSSVIPSAARVSSLSTRVFPLKIRLVLLALIVDFPDGGHLRFGLVLEKSVVKHLVVDVDLAHLRRGLILGLLLELLALLLLRVGVAELLDSGGLDERGKLPGQLLEPRFPCKNLRFWHQC